MRILIAVLLLTLTNLAKADQPEQVISVQHDSVRGVTCWILNNTGISCLPDTSLPQQATPAHEAGRASQACYGAENGPLVATPLPQKQGFDL